MPASRRCTSGRRCSASGEPAGIPRRHGPRRLVRGQRRHRDRRLRRAVHRRRGGGCPAVAASAARRAVPPPAQLPDGGVLVVGAGPSGQQLATELRRAGRPVVLAVGRHARMPRSYRGRDVFEWLQGHRPARRPRRRRPRPRRRTARPELPLERRGVARPRPPRPARRGRDRAGSWGSLSATRSLQPIFSARSGTPTGGCGARSRGSTSTSTRSGTTAGSGRAAAAALPSAPARHGSRWARPFAPCCGRRAIAARTPGSTSRSSTRRASWCTGKVSQPLPDCSCSASGSSARGKSHFLGGVGEDAAHIAAAIAARSGHAWWERAA